MFQEQIMLYIRENAVAAVALTGLILLLLLVLIQVTRTRQEVHNICEKVRRYFEVILAEEEEEAPVVEEASSEEIQIPVYQTMEERQEKEEDSKDREELKLLMEVISEVF